MILEISAHANDHYVSLVVAHDKRRISTDVPKAWLRDAELAAEVIHTSFDLFRQFGRVTA